MFENIIKTIYRVPIKSIIVLGILFFVSFALFSRVNEYVITSREFRELEDSFYGVGAVEVSPPQSCVWGIRSSYFLTSDRINRDSPDGTWEHTRYEPLTLDIINFINNISYVTSVDTRFMTAGIHSSFFRLDDREAFFNYSHRVIFEAALYSYRTTIWGDWDWDEDILPYANLSTIARFTDFVLLHDLPDYALTILQNFHNLNRDAFPIRSSFSGEIPDWIPDEYTVRITAARDYVDLSTMGRDSLTLSAAAVSNNIINNFEIGNRYVLVGLLNRDMYITLGCPTMGLWMYSLIMADAYNNPDLDLALEMTISDWHTFDIVYTNNMSSIYRFAHGQTSITEGRMLNPDDYGTNYAVISRVLANQYNLSIGDTVSFGLADRLHNQHVSLGAVSAGSRGRFARPVQQVDLEIIGIFSENTSETQIGNNPHWSYSSSTVFVPVSLLPDSVDMTNHVIHPGEFSFIIGNIRDAARFLEIYAPILRDMGVRLMFTDSGWGDIESDFLLTRRAATMAISVWLFAIIGVVILVVYLFIIRHKKEYAIMRSLGRTKTQTNLAVFLPLFLLGIISVSLGGITAAINTSRTMAQTPDIAMVLFLIFITLVFLAIVEWIGLIIAGRKPVLELLQGSGKR